MRVRSQGLCSNAFINLKVVFSQTRGKACVQCGHAVHRLYRRVKKLKDFSIVLKAWVRPPVKAFH